MLWSQYIFFFSSRRRHTRWPRDWSSDVCSSDLLHLVAQVEVGGGRVEEEYVGVLGEAGGEPDALAFAPGEGLDAAFGHVGDAADVHGALDGGGAVLVAGAPAAPVGVAPVADDVDDAD